MTSLVTEYGLMFVFANVLMTQLGLPIPAVPTLVVAGAAAAAGAMSPVALFAVAFTACALADASWYLGGRLYGRRLMKLLCRVSLSPDSCVRQSESRFQRWGRLTLVIAKFVPGLATLMPPLAGTMRLDWRAFATLDGLGVAMWVGVAVSLGMRFHRQVNGVLAGLQQFGALVLVGVGVLLLTFVAIKWWQRHLFHRNLRMARISVEELLQLIERGERPMVVDLRSAGARDEDRRSVPGALIMDFEDAERRLHDFPADRDIIFYCACPNEAGAAQVAKKLMRLGYTRVRPLAGGLEAWIAAGYEVGSGSPPSWPDELEPSLR